MCNLETELSLVSDRERQLFGFITREFLSELAVTATEDGGFHANSFKVGSKPGDRIDMIALLLGSGLATARPINEIDPDNGKQLYLINLDQSPRSVVEAGKAAKMENIDGSRKVVQRRHGEDIPDPDWIKEAEIDVEAEYAFRFELLKLLSENTGLKGDIPLREQLGLNIEI